VNVTFIDLKTAGGAGQLIVSTHMLDALPDLLIVRWSDGTIGTITFARQPAPAPPPAPPGP